jgi:3-hydroxybutyryl-CoA dehydrogenase
MGQARTIGIIGAGLMGHGIALTFARAGWSVVIHDPVSDALDSVLQRIETTLGVMGVAAIDVPSVIAHISCSPALSDAVAGAGVVIEAAPEKLALKQRIFAQIEQHASADAILASNTSVIPITQIMQNLSTAHRTVGTHWWNPPHMIPLVEVIKTQWTESAVAQRMFDILAEVGKTPVMVEKDVPGFIGNRLQHALWREAISLVENGICDAEAVDTVVKSSFGRRLSVLGPLENADLVGTELTLDIHENVLFDLESRQGPSPYLEKIIEQGRLGMKSGHGFRAWTEETANRVRNNVTEHLAKLEKIL